MIQAPVVFLTENTFKTQNIVNIIFGLIANEMGLDNWALRFIHTARF
jgi:hypothetical protein